MTSTKNPTRAEYDALAARLDALERVLLRYPPFLNVRDNLDMHERRVRLAAVAQRAQHDEISALPVNDQRDAFALLSQDQQIAFLERLEDPYSFRGAPTNLLDRMHVATLDLDPIVRVEKINLTNSQINGRRTYRLDQRQRDILVDGFAYLLTSDEPTADSRYYLARGPEIYEGQCVPLAAWNVWLDVDHELKGFVDQGFVVARELSRDELERRAMSEWTADYDLRPPRPRPKKRVSGDRTKEADQ